MRIVIAQILLAVLLSSSSQAQKSNILGSVSPKLRQFLTAHPEASLALSNAPSEAFHNRAVQLYYMYSDDESIARAFHYYPDETSVGIVIRENQQPCDECICLIYETLNSLGEKQFQELAERAKSGTVTKADFVKGIFQQEFPVEMKMQKIVGSFRITNKEKNESYFYNRLMQEPNGFEKAMAYKKKAAPKQELIKFYEREYDDLRDSESRSNTALEPTASAPSVSTNK